MGRNLFWDIKSAALDSLRLGEKYEFLMLSIYEEDSIIYIKDERSDSVIMINRYYSDGSKKMASRSEAAIRFSKICLYRLRFD